MYIVKSRGTLRVDRRRFSISRVIFMFLRDYHESSVCDGGHLSTLLSWLVVPRNLRILGPSEILQELEVPEYNPWNPFT